MIPLLQAVLFFGALFLLLGAGFVTWRFFFASHQPSFFIETLLFSFAIGITLIDFFMLLLGTTHIPLSGPLIALFSSYYPSCWRSHMVLQVSSRASNRSKHAFNRFSGQNLNALLSSLFLS
jgi:hypothetical protein